ncbi:MAG TPA: alpha/beta fold hydrolase [Propionibacteriaceae bacterium]|jgi:pimeloyl-ACP methyl ester carboxylesterase|nr:alpha/beta fold hydrolase [Propionibacteriaceae bacterium]
MRHAVGFMITMGLFGPGLAWGQSPACSAAAVTADPDTVDTDYPPSMRVVQIPSGGVRLNGVLYLAQGRGRHPTVVFLHGFPGDEKNLDLAQAVRRAGFNTLVFYYRGAWGSPGTYSYSHVLEDASAVLTWLREPAAADSMRVDAGRLILVGHSLGGFAALYTAATDDRVAAVAAVAPVDLGSRGAVMRDSVAFAKGAERRGAQLSALRGTSGEELSREAVTHADQWSLQRYANVLAQKRILLLAATKDNAVELSEVFEPLSARLRAEGAQKLTTITLPSDHLFSSARIRLAKTLITWLCRSM